MLGVTVICARPGGSPVDLTDLLDSGPSFSTAAVGGFADCTFALRGDQRRLVPYLSLVSVMLGPRVLYEGQVEDADPAGTGDSLRTTVTCFGLRNLLVENSVRRVWSKRDIAWIEAPGGVGGAIFNGLTKGDATLNIGRYDPTDLTKLGLRVAGNGVSVPTNAGRGAIYGLQSGMTIVRIMGTLAGTTWTCQTASSPTGINGSWTATGIGAAGAFNNAVNDRYLAFIAYNPSVAVIPATTQIDISDIRLLGTTIVEDAAGGFYGGTILRDLVALCPGLTLGLIEDGSDFTIQAIERAVRSQVLAAVEEVSGYYTREWAIWEDGRFDWKTRALDTPDWITTLPDLTTLSLDGTLDGLARTVYVLYTDAASGLDAEASAAATSQRNPYVKQGRAKDMTVQPGFPMTANTSAQLAARIAADIGQWVPVQGTITIPATKTVARAQGASGPAALIRGGDNILIADLPKTDLFQQGRDGETLFHIVSTTCDLTAGVVVLQLEGQARRSDVLLARLAAATRILTG